MERLCSECVRSDGADRFASVSFPSKLPHPHGQIVEIYIGGDVLASGHFVDRVAGQALLAAVSAQSSGRAALVDLISAAAVVHDQHRSLLP